LSAIARWLGRGLLLILALYGLAILSFVYLRYLPPLTTGVQIQRRVEAMISGDNYRKQFRFVPMDRIAPVLARAVVAAEDSRFHDHRGFDWVEIRAAREEAGRGGRRRGASTLSQQLVKNLFFTTHRSAIRKGVEFTLTPVAERVLGKERILELYLNVIEWGPGVYGAEAAARHHFGVSAADLSRDQATRLAAIIPAPRNRSPDRVGTYARIIDGRMRLMGW